MLNGEHKCVQGKIRLRLHGNRLPPNYTILLRIDRQSDFVKSAAPHIPRRRHVRARNRRSTYTRPSTPSLSPSSSSSSSHSSYQERSSSPSEDAIAATDQQIRAENAYPGAINSIGSIHQRRWFITLDRLDSGFVRETSSSSTSWKPQCQKKKGAPLWVRKRDSENEGETLGFEPFYVRGPDVEKSVVTGRLAKDVLNDEGVKGFVRRRGWRAVI